ncbi:hypothetical protein SAY87_001392 [Trapa incisa]|uniref:Transmembrane protein 220 n=2 Tax=Trapa TaxID=22665 RepID=A0AAN7LK91_TRANT|nr:hypothetical protein SAY87_001392 [Trapa incisa]KAK4789898.1 hypothetical protein SAY86_017202 [Trapa natans]
MAMAAHPKRMRIYTLLMALLFGYSASVQLNDPDWYLWLPLYTLACLVNLPGLQASASPIKRKMGKMALLLGLLLFFKVVVGDHMKGVAGFWSFDMRERVVREKFGSGLVVASMILHLTASSSSSPTESEVSRFVEYEMAILVGISYVLTFIFFVFHKADMKF